MPVYLAITTIKAETINPIRPIMQHPDAEPRATIYRLLGMAFLYPPDLDWERLSDAFPSLMGEACRELELETEIGFAKLEACWERSPGDGFLHAYTELFINSPRGVLAPINEAVYFGDQPQVNTERTAAVLAAYHQAGFAPGEPFRHLLPDHLCLELEFMALELLRGGETQEFFRDHVLSWQLQAAERVIAAGISPFYAELAGILTRFLRYEQVAILGPPSDLAS